MGAWLGHPLFSICSLSSLGDIGEDLSTGGKSSEMMGYRCSFLSHRSIVEQSQCTVQNWRDKKLGFKTSAERSKETFNNEMMLHLQN